jgi:uncharacterized protein with PIN domain/sulfur carrier protein ThiS
MSQAEFHFHAELNDFLGLARRGAAVTYRFGGRVSIKDTIESLGVPHTEIEAIVVGSTVVDFAYIVRDGDRVEVFPSPAPTAHATLRPPFPGQPRFVLDTHLGQLASYLRMLGFDTLYRNDYPDEELARIASQEPRILLTRDRGLLKRSIVTYGRFVRATDPRLQVVEIVRRYQLAGWKMPLRRCLACNGLLRPVRKEDVLDRLALNTRNYFHEFSQCESCGRVYWKGSHYDRMRRFVEQVLATGYGDGRA